MPSSLLFAIDNEGRVHTLSTSGSVWRELPYVGQEFKKLSAVSHFLWALGGDHQVYLYVYGLDIPIRVREESYENERWLPIEGFTARLLPTDRYRFSSADGTVNRSIDKIRLPSMAWQWEGDWQLELTLDGQPLDHNGWTYAVDFPMQYHPKKQWKSCVRRRLWVRSRRYSAMNSWCAIAPLHKDATTEPFIDISIGGQAVRGAESGKMLVWAVTSHNRVMFRLDVSTKLPEGSKWLSIPVPTGCEVNQISVGSTGLVWATLLDGRALVRVGVTRDSLSGTSWVEIRGPVDNLRLVHISVGTNGVWAVTQNKQVWFRKGVKGEGAGIGEEMAAGCGWVEMVGRMSVVSVAGNDQVWGVGSEDRTVYFRMGVSSCGDLTGKRWRMLHAPLQVSRASSSASLNRDRFNTSFHSLNQRPHSISEATAAGLSEWEDQSHSAPTAPTSLPVGDSTGKHFETQLKNPKAWSPVRSVGSVVGTEAHPETDRSVWQEDDSASLSLFYGDDDELCWGESGACWARVEAGGCTVDPTQLPNWFVEGNSLNQVELEQPWRLKILADLKVRVPGDRKFDHYPVAIDTTSWIYTSEARASLNGCAFEECLLQLEWVHTNGTLTLLNPDGATTMHQFSLDKVTYVQCCSEPGSPRLAIHTPDLRPPLMKIQFPGDTQLEEWQAHLATVCGQIHSAVGKPKRDGIWAVTNLGETFVSDAQEIIEAQIRDGSTYVREVDLVGKEIPFDIPLHAELAPGSEVTVYGCVADNADRIAINLEAHSNYKSKHKTHMELQNCCLHFNPRFEANVVVRNHMVGGCWGEEERSGEMPLKRGQEFAIKFACEENAYTVYVNETEFCTFKHRLSPYSVYAVKISGHLRPFKLHVKNTVPMLNPKNLFWRQIGGHLRKVESCFAGVTWGIGHDRTAWVHNGGWGGAFFGSMESHNVSPMTDSQDYRVYENQRWNPVTGYTSAGLPTDRHMWSDATGKQKRVKDQIKLLSMHWQWVSDWLVDFHVPGGVDREGWQYAVDFPSSFHANKHFTDYVRRRRWYRRCAIATSGPWQELGHTKLLDVSLEPLDDSPDSDIAVWALATGGQAMVRVGVTRSNPAGTVWEHVNSSMALCSISCGPYKQVWAVGKSGCAFWRVGINSMKLEGDNWVCVEPPSGARLTQISVGRIGVWAVDSLGRIQVRKEVSAVFPEGTHWQCLEIDPPAASGYSDSTRYTLKPNVADSASHTACFQQVCVGRKSVWALTDSGVVLRRHGIFPANPTGTGWDIGIHGTFQHLSVKAFA